MDVLQVSHVAAEVGVDPDDAGEVGEDPPPPQETSTGKMAAKAKRLRLIIGTPLQARRSRIAGTFNRTPQAFLAVSKSCAEILLIDDVGDVGGATPIVSIRHVSVLSGNILMIQIGVTGHMCISFRYEFFSSPIVPKL
jgi:hypothetical protein